MFSFFELLKTNNEGSGNASNSSLSLKSKIVRMVGLAVNKYDVAKFIKNGAIYFMLSFWKPIYKDLSPLLGTGKRSASFVTVCQSCHKRINVNVASYGFREMILQFLSKNNPPDPVRAHVFETVICTTILLCGMAASTLLIFMHL